MIIWHTIGYDLSYSAILQNVKYCSKTGVAIYFQIPSCRNERDINKYFASCQENFLHLSNFVTIYSNMNEITHHSPTTIYGTTILCVRKNSSVVIAGDGQVSFGNTVMKNNAVKVRRLGEKSAVLTGFAGATADAFTLFERLEKKLEQYPSQLTRAAVELAKDWRSDKFLRKLEAMMIVADEKSSLVLSGTGDVIEPEDGVIAIGSGGMYALAAAKALYDHLDDAEQIARRAMDIAADICIYTNKHITVEKL